MRDRAAQLQIPRERWLMTAAYAAVLIPVLAATVSLIGANWAPLSDHAFVLMRTSDVGGSHTPLVGAWSRWGWSHPGPALFWYLAPWYRLLGNDGVLIGAGVLSAAAIAASVAVARRVGGVTVAALVALVVTLMQFARGLALSSDPWNPYVAFWPFLLLALLTWACLSGDRWCLPVAVGVGSWCAQAHIGFAPIAMVFVAAAAVGIAVGWYRERNDDGALRRLATVTGAATAVAAIVWAPVLVDQIAGSGNLSALLEYLRDQRETKGWAAAWGIANVQLGPLPPWVGGADRYDDGISLHRAGYEAVAALIVVTASMIAASWARQRRAAALCAVALMGVALALASTSRLSGFLVPYLHEWWWIVAAICALAVTWVVIVLVQQRVAQAGGASGAPTAATHLPTAIAAGVLVLACGFAAITTVRDLPVDVRFAEATVALHEVADQAASRLDPDERYLIRAVERVYMFGSGHGLHLLLEQRGLSVYSQPGGSLGSEPVDLQMSEHRLASADEVDALITIVSLDQIDDPFAVPDDAEEIAFSDPRATGDGEAGYAVFVSPVEP